MLSRCFRLKALLIPDVLFVTPFLPVACVTPVRDRSVVVVLLWDPFFGICVVIVWSHFVQKGSSISEESFILMLVLPLAAHESNMSLACMCKMYSCWTFTENKFYFIDWELVLQYSHPYSPCRIKWKNLEAMQDIHLRDHLFIFRILSIWRMIRTVISFLFALFSQFVLFHYTRNRSTSAAYGTVDRS